MATLLVTFTIFLPLVYGAIQLAFFHGTDRHRQMIASAIVLAISSAFMLSAFFSSAPPPRFCLSWLVSAGDMCISFDKSSLTLIAFICLFPLLIHLNPHLKTAQYSTKASGLMLIAFASMQIALLSEHFLLRYAALEITGLTIVAVALLLTNPSEKRWDHTKRVFLNLRVGDITLLVAILMMFARSNSFNIAQNFKDSLALESGLRWILTVCLLVAVWVKMAIWPLDQWQVANASLPQGGIKEWFTDICMPTLGAYLLYRSAPLLQAGKQPLIGWVLAFGIISYLSDFLQPSIERDISYLRNG